MRAPVRSDCAIISPAALTVVVVVAGAVAMALVGWLLGVRRARRGQPPVWGERWRSAVTTLVVLGAVASRSWRRSSGRSGCCSRPELRTRTRRERPVLDVQILRPACYERMGVELRRFSRPPGAVRQMGISPHNQKKRFDTEVRAARARGVADLDEARRQRSRGARRRDRRAPTARRKVGRDTHHDHAHRVQPRIRRPRHGPYRAPGTRPG